MANGRSKKTVNLSFNGRGIAVAVIAVISGACFALGYFVGQATSENSVQEIVLSAPPVETTDDTEETIMPSDISTDLSAVPASSEGKALDTQRRASEMEPSVGKKAVPHISGPKTLVQRTQRTVYSVQIGAFQNRRDAETMQSKFKSKGYSIYILRTRTKDQKTIYKVRAGKFNDRAEAERLALKLKQIEGVSPFITSL